MARRPKKTAPVDSPALALVRHVMAHEGECFSARSWTRTESALTSAVSLAIVHGLRFDADDFITMADRPQRFDDNPRSFGWSPPEWVYSRACAKDRAFGTNLSACVAYEKFVGRPPWIYKDSYCISGRRLCLGDQVLLYTNEPIATIRGRGELTSFNDNAGTIIVCDYYTEAEMEDRRQVEQTAVVIRGEAPASNPPPLGDTRRKTPKTRLTVTRQMLLEHNRAFAAARAAQQVGQNVDVLA